MKLVTTHRSKKVHAAWGATLAHGNGGRGLQTLCGVLDYADKFIVIDYNPMNPDDKPDICLKCLKRKAELEAL